MAKPSFLLASRNVTLWAACFVLLTSSLMAFSGCTFRHSRQAIGADVLATPADDARFVTEEDAGLALLGLLVLSEPDHYAVLMERARRKNDCARLTHAQLDYYSDGWILVSFPIARITALCEPRREGSPSPNGPDVDGEPTGPRGPSTDADPPPEPAASSGPAPEPAPLPQAEPEPTPSEDPEPESPAPAPTP